MTPSLPQTFANIREIADVYERGTADGTISHAEAFSVLHKIIRDCRTQLESMRSAGFGPSLPVTLEREL